jgi:hypothetical protein
MTWENDLSSYQEKSIVTTFVCQLQDLERQFQDASNLLKFLAYLYPESISLDMLQIAEALFNEMLRCQEDQFGSHDCRTFWTMHQLACIYREQRRREETEKLLTRIFLGGTENLSGPEHAQTVANLQVLVSNSHVHGLHGEVEATLLEVLAFRERILGLHHLHTRETMQLLAVLYKNLDRRDDLQAVNQRLVELC